VGNLYISDHYLCFMGETKLPAPDNGITRLAFMVPLINILCWHRANILKCDSARDSVRFLDLNDFFPQVQLER